MTATITTPVLFADFTTEGGTNNYIFNFKKVVGTATDWLTAVGLTYSNAGGKYVTNSSGVLTLLSANVLPFDFDPITLAAKGLLLEGASTNLALGSGDLGNSTFWTNFTSGAGSITTTSNAGTAPDGTNTATKFVINRAAGSDDARAIQNGAAFSALTYTTSCYVKAFAAGDIGKTITIYEYDGVALNEATITLTANWQRGMATHSLNAVASGQIGIGYVNGDSAGTGAVNFLAWGMQTEQLTGASSYIPTTNATASRTTDLLTATLSSWFNGATTTLYAAAETAAPGTGNIISIDDGSLSNRLLLGNTGSGPQFLSFVEAGGTTQFNALSSDPGQSPYVANVLRRTAIAAQASNFTFVADSGAADAGNSGVMPVSPTTLILGGASGLTNLYGHLAQVGYWDSVLSIADLQGLTSGSFIFAPVVKGPNVQTTLTNVPSKFFTKKHYSDLIDEIRNEGEIARSVLEGLSEKDKADLKYEAAKRDFDELEGALNRSVSLVNWSKTAEAQEKLERARKDRDHHYYMEIVDKLWAEHNKKQKK